jgi:hypothetical protein
VPIALQGAVALLLPAGCEKVWFPADYPDGAISRLQIGGTVK